MITTILSRTNLHWAAAIAAAALMTLNGCGNESGHDKGSNPGDAAARITIIQNKGSDTMANLAQSWAREYKKVNPAVDIEVGGGGSGGGIAALIKGTADIVNASRHIRPAEAEQVKQNTGREPQEFVVGYDALVIYVHKDNPLNQISREQLAAIYEEDGHITRWSQLGVKIPGCEKDEIVRVNRHPSSGTYEFLHEHVLSNKNFKPGAREVNSSKEAVDLVGSTPCALGYSGMSYATPHVKALKVANKQGEPAYAPNFETTRNKTYPFARSLQVYTVGPPDGPLQHYLHWVLSDAGQHLVESNGFVPIPSTARIRQGEALATPKDKRRNP